MTKAATATLTGRVVRPGDDDYAEASAGWNRLHSHRPAAVVFARETADVVNALAWARRQGMPVRARSGRHALEGWSAVDDGLVIDVSEMKSVAIDRETHTATVGAGLNQLEAVTALGAAGFAAPTGTEGSVGLVGATLGGGFGLLTRAYGMASDNLLAAEIVTAPADGGAAPLVVDEQHHAELLWALRGAGNGNFGIVTSLTYRIQPLAQAIYVVATWAGLDDFGTVFDTWQRTAPFTDDRLTSQLEATRDAVVLIAVLADGSEAEARELLEPLVSIGRPAVVATDAPWADTYAAFQIPVEDEPANWKFTSQFISDPFPAEAIDLLAAKLASAPPECNYFTNAFGGAVRASAPADGSAFAHRDALFYAEPGAGWGVRGGPPADDRLTAACLDWVADVSAALAPYGNGAYVNVPNAGVSDWETAYWGANVGRLRTIKAEYDPCRIFDIEQGIR
ncbi:FAD-binding oxidoreductase [Mycolicibacterium sp. F2034L]|uniref:FAD-binding oxidoreductase n=1 Tax=Mycolicibacterium sp. F2034L TaxID=2926422 RepID=UPI001FF226D9|nr:FAD-binding oxidoreductase [Mycolicibacterium sp. F2034L]MCK0173454.1 FAD-binding oxidoreductase [Mycolicibacterium sp. F2034L]